MSRKTQITVPEDIDTIVHAYVESQKIIQPNISWTEALLQLARIGSIQSKEEVK